MIGFESSGQDNRSGNDDESWYENMDRGSGRLQRKRLEKSDMTPDIRREYDGAKNDLRTIENGATGADSGTEEGGDSIGASAAEKREQSELYNSELEQGDNKGGRGGKQKSLVKGLLKRGPMALIFGLIFSVGGVMIGGQSMLPFSLIAQLSETYDSIKVSSLMRSDTMWAKQLEQSNLRSPLYKRYFGFGGDAFKVRSRQRSKLSRQGIYVAEADCGGRSTKTVMLFDDGSGSLKVVAAGDADVSVIKGLDSSKIDLSGIDADVDLSHMSIDTDNVMTFKGAYTDISDFRNGYIAGSRTWRGSVSAWFDSITVKFLQSNRLTRNMFKKYQQRVMEEQAGNTRSAAKKATVDAMNDGATDEISTTVRRHDGEEAYETDADGNTTMQHVESDNSANGAAVIDGDMTDVSQTVNVPKKATKAQIQAKMNEIKNGKLGKASGYVSAAVNVACTVFDVIGAINLLLVAKETMEIVQVTTGFFEAVDKVKAGDGSDSPINVFAEGLTTPKSTTVMQNVTNDVSVLENSSDVDIEEVVADGKDGTTAMQSAGIMSLYAGSAINTNDASVQNFNIGSRFSSILGYLSNSLTSFAACAVAKAAAAVADMVVDIVAIVTCAVSFGIGCIVNALGQAGTSAGVSIAIGLAATLAINIITPFAVKIFTRDLVSDLAGEDFGNALVSGANVYMGNNHLQGGGSLANWDKYTAYRLNQDAVIAEEARYERETRSPFDITSQYTFMGNMLKQLATMYTLPSSVFGFFGNTVRMMSSSIMAVLPSASAYDIATTVKPADDEEYARNCPFLSSIDAVGDAFCNPYMVTDVSTLNMDPLDVVDEVATRGGLNDDGSIKKNSNLAKYITYCSQRSSAFGVADVNVANSFAPANIETGNGVANTVVNGAIGSVPVVGDILDIINNGVELGNTGWITGQSCVASGNALVNDDNVTLGVSWSENVYYQRFVEDQRLLESIDPEYESVVTAFLDEYYEEHPLDNSYEGILARKSGLAKETVVAILDIMDYYTYVANYDPSERYVFGAPMVETDDRPLFSNGDEVAEKVYIITLNNILYADVRNRSFAV